MARVTVEDCLRNVKNRFELVMIAAKRARQLMRGKEPKVEWDNDKATVVALREIAEGYTNFDAHESSEQHELHALHQHISEHQAQMAHAASHLTVIETIKVEEEVEEETNPAQDAQPETPTATDEE